MKLQGLRALLAIVEHGSFSEAALELGTSQSTVSYAIAELEEELGVKLLARGRFGAVTTPVGDRVVTHARAVERSLAAIGQEASLDRGDLTGELRVSAFRSLASHVLAPAMSALSASRPGLRIELLEVSSRSRSQLADLHGGRVDVALTMSLLAKDAVYWELFRDDYVAVVPDSLSPGHGDTLQDLMARPILLSDGPCSWPVRDALLAADPAFRPTMEIAEDSTMLALAGRGVGVALMPRLTVDAVPAGTRMVKIEPHIDRGLGVALLPSALRVPAVRVFLAQLREMFPACEVPVLDGAFRGAERLAPSIDSLSVPRH